MSKVNLSNLTNLQSEVAAVTTINNNNTLITQAIENTISRDGTLPNTMNSRLDMNSNQIINLPDATTDQEPVTYGQYVDGITSVNNGVVVDGSFILAEHDDTTINDRVLAAGDNIQLLDGGPKGEFVVRVSDAELNAIADVVSAADKVPYFTGLGTADVADFTPYARTLVDDADAATARATLGLVIDTDVQPHDPTLNSLVSAGNGIMTKTAANTITPRTITAPANGISITDGDGVAGNPTLALTNDLAAIEGLATTGIIARTATDTAATRTVTGTANEITVTDGDGVSGNPTISIPNSVTFTGKTVTGGTFSSPTINTPSGITKSDVGLSNVDNTSDATKNAAVATLTNKTLTSPVINSPTGIVKGDVGLGNVDNTSDATKNAASATLTNKTISGSSNTLSNISNASLSSAADSTIKSNISGSAASPSDNTITAVLDKQLGTTQGTIAYRGATAWNALTPGTAGYFLQTQGASANPTWTSVPGGGDLLSTNNLSDLSNADTSLTNLGGTTVGKSIFKAASVPAVRGILAYPGYLFGLTLSTAGSSSTFSIASGIATDSTFSDSMNLSSAYSKTTSSWTVGSANGALDTGSIAASTWYHVFLIKRTDTGVVDVLISTSATSPTLPTNYTLFRRIGSMKTDGSSQWVKFSQNGDEFLWDVPVNNVSASPGTTAIQTATVTTPTGIKMLALLNVGGSGSDSRGWVFSPDVNSGGAASGTLSTINAGASIGAGQSWGSQRVRTNTSSQVKYALTNSAGALFITTAGWVDDRGKLQ